MNRLSKKIYNYLNIDNKLKELERVIRRESDAQKMLLGQILTAELLKKGRLDNIHEAQFSVFSQGGDDGILQYLISRVKCPKTFVDVGGGNYTEPDTRFLLQNNLWRGLAIDGGDELRPQDLHLYDLERRSIFLTAKNINESIEKFDEIGFLNIDIDGNDYWIWKAVETRPVIVAVEYNSLFGLSPVTIPYIEDFSRDTNPYGAIYCGASLTALCDLAEERATPLWVRARSASTPTSCGRIKLGISKY